MVVVRRQRADGADGGGEMRGAAVVEIVAVDRRDDDVIEPQLRHRLRDVVGLACIERARQSGLDVAERAGARAGVAHDHHGGVAPGPALGDVGAARLLAHRDEAVLAQDRARLGELRRGRRHLHPDPVRLAQHRRVGLVGLLGVPGALVEDGDHCCESGWVAHGKSSRRRLTCMADLLRDQPSARLPARSGEEGMRRPLRAALLDVSKSCFQVPCRKLDPEMPLQHLGDSPARRCSMRRSASPEACRMVNRALNKVSRVLPGPGRAAIMLLR